MSKPILRDPSQEDLPAASEARQGRLPIAEPRPADVEMARVLKTAPIRMASDPSGGGIAHWKHGALHDVVEPMADHVIMTYNRRCSDWSGATGRSVAIGTARPGVVTIIPAGSSARWDIPGPSMSFSSIFRTQRSSALPAKPTRPHRAICWSERGIPIPLHPDCS